MRSTNFNVSLLALISFSVISLTLVLAMFTDNQHLAGGEEGIPLYNPDVTFKKFISPWYEVGTGDPIPVYLPRSTFIVFFILLRKILPLVWSQALLFFLLLNLGMIGAFYLIKELTANKMAAFFSAIFYLLNLYTLSQIWGRFLYTSIFTWTYLPIFLYLWIKSLRERKAKWLLIFLASSILFSNSFGHPADVFTLWIPAITFLLIEFWRVRKIGAEIISLSTHSLINFASWFLVNTWWFYPYVKLADQGFSEIANWKSNFDSLVSVSQYFTNPTLFLLRQDFLFGKGGSLYTFYSQPLVYMLSVVILIVMILGVFTSRKTVYFGYIFFFMIISWLLVKGSNFPFGDYFYKFLFINLPITQVFRNPYEKLGTAFILPYAVFFGLGLAWIFNNLPKRVSFISATLILIFCFGVLVWPLWTGAIMKNKLVNIPNYYIDANNWLNTNLDDLRVFHVPATPGEGMVYKWGYNGVESSEFLFDKPSVAKILRAKYYDKKYLGLVDEFNKGADYENYLYEMNIGYVVVHKDIDPNTKLADYGKIQEMLNKNLNFEFMKSFSGLDIYKYKKVPAFGLFEELEGRAVISHYTKLNTLHYQVFIKDATEPFNLIFKTTFNDYWELRENGIKLGDHFLVYDYANGWKIDKRGSYKLDVTFRIWPWD